MVYVCGNKKQEETMIGEGRVHLNPATGLPQTFGPKVCKICGDLYTPVAPCHLYCSQYCADTSHSENYLRRNYKISLEEAACIFEKQSGRCAVCGSKGFRMNPNAMFLLVVDHDHTTGKVRGMLCHNCNRALGLLQDNISALETSIKYLESATTIPEGSTPKQVEAVDLDDIV